MQPRTQLKQLRSASVSLNACIPKYTRLSQ